MAKRDRPGDGAAMTGWAPGPAAPSGHTGCRSEFLARIGRDLQAQATYANAMRAPLPERLAAVVRKLAAERG